jgi:hypothetical protein
VSYLAFAARASMICRGDDVNGASLLFLDHAASDTRA